MAIEQWNSHQRNDSNEQFQERWTSLSRDNRPPSSHIARDPFFTLDHGFLPTTKDLSGVLGIPHAGVRKQVNQRVRKGCLKREPGKAHGIVTVREPDDTRSEK